MTNPSYGSSSEADSWSGNLLRSGTVTDRRLTNAGPQVQVQYPDRGVTSDWIPVGQQGSKGAVFHFCPRVGDSVTCAHFPTGIETAIVIATNCTPNNPGVKPTSLNAVGLMMENGEYLEYNPDSGCLSINGVATVYVNAKGQIQIIAGGDLDVTTSANLNATVSGNLVANVSGTTTLTSGSTVINGPVRFNGAVTMETTLEVVGNVQFDSTGTIATHLSNGDGDGGGS